MTDATAEEAPSFEDCFRDEYPSIVRTLVPIVVDRAEAEAVAQDAFLKALRRWRRIRTLDRPGAWIRRVAIRDAVRSVQRLRRSRELGDHAAVTPDSDTRLDVARAIEALPGQQRAAIALHYFEGRPADDIADALGCATATVRVHLHRARQSLSVQLGVNAEREEIR